MFYVGPDVHLQPDAGARRHRPDADLRRRSTWRANYLQLRYQRSEMSIRGRIAGLVLNLVTGVSKLRICGAENACVPRLGAAVRAAAQDQLHRSATIQNSAARVQRRSFRSCRRSRSSYVMLREQAAAGGGPAALTTGEFIAFNAAYRSVPRARCRRSATRRSACCASLPIYERLVPILDSEAGGRSHRRRFPAS